ncbi:flavodoxin domain-containing protein [Halobacteriovorax sp. RZ-1]|uniref:flavodoxin domain-containing protein n=1 Tax=unclassified Halobacteriovorax TaxID=2639665 RepID=UPI0037129EC1
MKKALIIYATREGQTEKVAHKIRDHFIEAKIETSLHDARNVVKENLEEFDLLVFGGSMHIGGIEKELVNFINDHKEQIESKPNAFFLVLLSAATKDPVLREEWLNDARKRVDKQLITKFNRFEMVAGALKYSKYSWPMKWIMRMIAKRAGEGTDFGRDYEYTDWKKVKEFAYSLI